jgi:hypothetical protein
MSQSLIFLALRSKYQIRASEGTVYEPVRISTAEMEKPSPIYERGPAEPEKNRTTYNRRASIYIPIFSVLVLFLALILYYNYSIILTIVDKKIEVGG